MYLMPNHFSCIYAHASANNVLSPQMILQQQKQNQMQRDPSDMDGNRRPSSPGGAENAPSPNKRPRLEGNTPFNPQQAAMMPNGRPQPGIPGQQQVSNTSAVQSHTQTAQLLIANNINPTSLTPQQFQNFQNQPPANQQKSIATYAQNMAGHHGNQMPNKAMGNPGVPPGQGSPMMQPNGAELNTFYNAEGLAGGARMAGAPGNGQGGGSNHALQDYQMQLMLLEQQNKKRLMMARQEQDSLGGGMPRGDGSAGPGGPGGPPGPNGQPFPDASPQGGRAGASPNPSEQMKRGTPQMNPAGIPSPLPEGGQSRGSPNPMSFMPQNVNVGDPNVAPHFFGAKGMNGMDGNMVQMNGGMRPPSSHPGQTFNGGQMNPQQMMAARGGQPGGPGGPQMQWQGGPNGGPMVPQGPPGQVQGTPQQRAMPPPSAPAPGGTANGRTQPSSPAVSNAAPPTPQQSNKAAPKKKDTKGAKGKVTILQRCNPLIFLMLTMLITRRLQRRPTTQQVPLRLPSNHRNQSPLHPRLPSPPSTLPTTLPRTGRMLVRANRRPMLRRLLLQLRLPLLLQCTRIPRRASWRTRVKWTLGWNSPRLPLTTCSKISTSTHSSMTTMAVMEDSTSTRPRSWKVLGRLAPNSLGSFSISYCEPVLLYASRALLAMVELLVLLSWYCIYSHPLHRTPFIFIGHVKALVGYLRVSHCSWRL